MVKGVVVCVVVVGFDVVLVVVRAVDVIGLVVGFVVVVVFVATRNNIKTKSTFIEHEYNLLVSLFGSNTQTEP